jgi:hypothetical protein
LDLCSTPIWWRRAKFSNSRAARERKIEDKVARSVVRGIGIGENYERKIIPNPLRYFEIFERHSPRHHLPKHTEVVARSVLGGLHHENAWEKMAA